MPRAGIVATSERHAAEAGARILEQGGTAVDAAVAAAAALVVTEPTSNGLGGDLFALLHDGAVHALDAAGAAPRRLDPEPIRSLGRVPLEGWAPVTTPGQVAGWEALVRRHGRMALSEVLAPAIALARTGFPVGPVTAAAWARAVPRFVGFAEWARVFLPGGRPPRAGEIFRNHDLADSLEAIARDGADAFYRGALARRIVACAEREGGALRADDLAAVQARWVEPLAVGFGRWRIVGMTPPTQGVVALEALALLEPGADDHRAIEAVKLAFADGYAHLADPGAIRIEVADLLDPAFVAARRAAIGPRATAPVARPGRIGGTVLVCASDAEGRLVSLIQSNFHGFGSGIVVPGTGIALQNRGAGFVLDPGHPNAIAPGKRPFHTILPGLILGADGPVGAFGCMGGQMQPQGQVQLVTALAEGLDPQAALDRPRWRWTDDGEVWLEEGFDARRAEALRRRGHRVVPDQPPWAFGGGQLVLADGRAGSDRRKDGGVARAG